ncbi:MAG: ArnT family glycosyltransferase [Kiloniellales bacterium]
MADPRTHAAPGLSPHAGEAGGHMLIWAMVAFYLAVTAAKVVIAANLDLFWDEAYYWQASSRLDVGYADKPFMTALLVRIGTLVAGDTRLGVRLAYLMIGAAFPFAIYTLAHPLVGRRDAVLAAGASLIMPITALMGVLAFQDIPMLLFGVLALASFERARRTDDLSHWLLAGLFCGLGFSTHYRFVPFVLGLFAYLVLTRRGRALWRRQGLWLATALAVLGLLPILIFNLETGFASFQFQVVDRNPWQFQARGLRFPLEQAIAVTPLLFVALMATLIDAARRAWKGDDGRALMAICAAVYLGFYLVLNPWADQKHFNLHWPAAGYVPLLVLLPEALRRFAAGGAKALGRGLRRGLAALIPVTGGLVVCGALIYLATAAWPAAPFADRLVRQVRHHDLIAWSQLADRVAGLLRTDLAAAEGGRAVLVGGHYRVASALDFILQPGQKVYVLDHRRNLKDGYQLQYVLWRLDEASLRREQAGATALIVHEDRRFWFNAHRELAWRARLCSVFDGLRQVDDLELPAGSRYFLIYSGRVRGPDGPRTAARHAPAPGPGNCATLPAAYIARPQRRDRVEGRVQVWGWAVDDAVGVAEVEVLVDGRAVGRAEYGGGWPRVRELMPGSSDPNHPNVGFSLYWDSTTVGEGAHRLAIRVRSNDGRTRTLAPRTIFVVHPD